MFETRPAAPIRVVAGLFLNGLPASIEPGKGARLPSKTETFEDSSNGEVARVATGHIYVVYSKDRDSEFYTLFRVEKLEPSVKVTISWKAVSSPEPAILAAVDKL